MLTFYFIYLVGHLNNPFYSVLLTRKSTNCKKGKGDNQNKSKIEVVRTDADKRAFYCMKENMQQMEGRQSSN